MNVYSQKGFYLHPTIETKQCFTNRDKSYSITTQQGLVVNVKSFNMPTVGGADLGLLIGYRTKFFFFETGISQNGTLEGITMLNPYFGKDIKSPLAAGKITLMSGSNSLNKLPFRIGFKVFGEDSIVAQRKLRWQGFVYGGIDYLYSTKPGIGASDISNGFVIDAAQHYLSVDFVQDLDLKRRHALFGNVGFMIKTYTKKGRTFLNISLDYRQTLQPNNILDVNKVVIQNYDGSTYTSIFKTRGSCFTFTFSTDIYFNRKQFKSP